MFKEVPFTLSDSAKVALMNIGRTEDVAFSPNKNFLAIVSFSGNKIVIFRVEVHETDLEMRLVVDHALTVFSLHLKYPHGVAWLDDESLIVANRKGDVTLFRLPLNAGLASVELLPFQHFSNRNVLSEPGSVCVCKLDQHHLEVFVCNNSSSTVAQYILREKSFSIVSGSILLEKDLDLPDGIAVSRDCRFIAVSIHNKHQVYVYKRTRFLSRESSPCAVLHGFEFPHGVVFSEDNGYIFVLDAGGIFAHVFSSGGKDWDGDFYSTFKIQLIDEGVFNKGRNNVAEGGQKGISLFYDDRILVTTSEEAPLVFHDVSFVTHNNKITASAASVHVSSHEKITASLFCHLRGVNSLMESALLQHVEKTNELSSKIECVKLKLEQQKNEFEFIIDGLTAKLEMQRNELLLIEKSRSMQITAPLRLFMILFRRICSGVISQVKAKI